MYVHLEKKEKIYIYIFNKLLAHTQNNHGKHQARLSLVVSIDCLSKRKISTSESWDREQRERRKRKKRKGRGDGRHLSFQSTPASRIESVFTSIQRNRGTNKSGTGTNTHTQPGTIT